MAQKEEEEVPVVAVGGHQVILVPVGIGRVPQVIHPVVIEGMLVDRVVGSNLRKLFFVL